MIGKKIRSYLLAGLGVWIPIIVTFVIVRFMVQLLDDTIALLPEPYQPQQLFGMNIPGLGVLMSLIILLFTGLFATNFLGQKLVKWSEALLNKIPFVRSIYTATKQVIQTIFSSNSNSFRQVLLVEYPREGLWSLAFQTGSVSPDIQNLITNEEMVSIFIPTTPNPTGGFFMMVPKSKTIPIPISIDEAFKMIISLGVMQGKKIEPTMLTLYELYLKMVR